MIPRGAQSFLVDRIKRKAFAELHRTVDGEAALLEMYLAAENPPESDAIFQELSRTAPEWLVCQLDARCADERRHAEWLRARLVELGRGRVRREEFALAGRRVEQLKALADRWGGDFSAGRVVPLVAILFALESAAVRAMKRHLAVLDGQAVGHPTAALLARILADEKRHALESERALDRLIRPAEKLKLRRVLDEADEIDRRLGVTGAVGMYALALALRGVGAVRGAARVAVRAAEAVL